MPAKGVEILHVWALGSANTGLAGNMSDTLIYYADDSTRAAASESVTIAEIGSSGDYAITYTPLLSGTYKLLVDESSLAIEYYWEDIVTDTPSAAVDSNSYCSEADVVAFVQMGDYTANTTPTETQVLTFMQMRAAEIYGWLREVMGSSATGPSAYDTSIDTSTDKGLALSRVCKLANAVGAAMDALEAAGSTEAPARTERVAELGQMYASLKPEVQASSRQYVGSGNIGSTHISIGEVSEESRDSVEEQGFIFDADTSW